MKKLFASLAGIGIAGLFLTKGAFAYTVQDGDTMKKLAEKENVNIEDIQELNHQITDVNKIFVGEEITLPSELNIGITQPEQTQQVKEVYTSQPQVQQEVVETEKSVVPVPAPVIDQPKQQPKIEVKQTSSAINQPSVNGSVKERFLAAGGTEAMWNIIVMPESSGNPNAVNELGYSGLGQTKESWGKGSIEYQTKGMINYAKERYGSVDKALAFRSANNWW